MNKQQSHNRSLGDASSLVAVPADEAILVDGGGILSSFKAAAKWVYNNVYVDVKNRVIGGKGTF